MALARRSAFFLSFGLLLSLLPTGCDSRLEALDADEDGFSPEEGDCWDVVEGPEGSGLAGKDIHPDAEDLDLGDGVDQDCDLDLDEDGHLPVAREGDDCDDEAPEINPDAVEICDAVDNDCDAAIDEDDPDLEPDVWYLDADGDGFGNPENRVEDCEEPTDYVALGGDCDDNRADVYPGAVEVCDEVDQDCDDLVDDEASNAATWYPDADEDGFGDPDQPLEACTQPEGYLEDGSDCDDGDADVNDDGIETCDGEDEDCDGEVDEEAVDASTWHPDADEDGYGDRNETLSETACTQPEGYLEDSQDCDDGDSDVNPEGTEVCNDQDDDCDDQTDEDATDAGSWYLDEDKDGYGVAAVSSVACDNPDATRFTDMTGDCNDQDAAVFPESGLEEVCGDGELQDCESEEEALRQECQEEASASAADAIRYGNEDNDTLAETLAAAGDVDGDGFADLLLAAPDSGDGVYLLSGALVRGEASLAVVGDYTALRTAGVSELLGTGLGGGEDLDADGYDDVLMGAPENDAGGSKRGVAYVAFGPLSGSSAASGSDVLARGTVNNQFTGSAVAAGDVSGDGVVDLLIGASGYKDGSDTNAGAVFVLAGPLSAGTVSLSTEYDARLIGADSSDRFGVSLVSAGDVDGDGSGDLLAGSPGSNDGGADAGEVLLLLGPVSTGIADDTAALSFRGEAGDEAGTSLGSPGDVDGDGYADLLIGAPGRDSGLGAAVLYLGRTTVSLPLSADSGDVAALFVGASAGDALGSAVAGALDLEGDGLGDLALGAPGYSDSGAVWLLSGLSTGTVALGDAGVVIVGGAAGDAFGTAVAGLGDTDGDGWDDLAVGAPGYDSTAHTDAGALFLFARWY